MSNLCIRMILTMSRIVLALTSERQLRKTVNLYGARSFSVAAPTLRNTLPFDIKNGSSVSVFKNKLKTFLFEKHFYNFRRFDFSHVLF